MTYGIRDLDDLVRNKCAEMIVSALMGERTFDEKGLIYREKKGRHFDGSHRSSSRHSYF